MKFEMPEETNLSSREKFKKAKKEHPDPRSIIRGSIKEMPGRIRNKIDHRLGDSNQNWLNIRGEVMAEKSGANELIEKFDDNKEAWVVDFGGGKEHILLKFIQNNPEKNLKTASVDLSDYASEKVHRSKEGRKMNSIFGNVENMPIHSNKAELSTAYFTFQELNDDQWEKVLDEMIRTTKDSGRIIIVDEPPQENNQKEGLAARGKNILRNLKVSIFNLHDEEYWRNLFEKKGLKIVDRKEFREDGKEVSEENPAQFFSYILEKAENKPE